MTGIYESLSVCLYAAGTALLIAAAAVYKKNGLYEYYCLMRGKPVRAKGAEKTAGRGAGRSRGNGIWGEDSSIAAVPRTMKPAEADKGTQILDGSADTTLLGKEGGVEGKTSSPALRGRVWGRPTERFRVTKSEMVIYTDKSIRARAGIKGEEDEV